MAFTLPDLPYDADALAPHVSAETLSYHHGRHHAGYVKKLNAATEGTAFARMPIEELVQRTAEVPEGKRTAVFRNACQHFNHAFYWTSMTPEDTEPSEELARAIDAAFGGLNELRDALFDEAGAHFGSGWGWVVQTSEGGVDVVSTHDADTPLAHGSTPLLALDVWEHAYYIDYRNARGDYLESFWNLVDWRFVSQNFAD